MEQTKKIASIIDVRSPQEFAAGHFPNAINIPLEQVAAKLEELRNLPKPIVTYCISGNRSGMAVLILKQNGIRDAINGGGLDDMLKRPLYISLLEQPKPQVKPVRKTIFSKWNLKNWIVRNKVV